MGDFTAVRPFIYVPGNIIASAQNNANEVEVYNEHNAAMSGTTGHTHDGTTGNGAPIVLQNAAPTVTRQIGFSGGQPQFNNGSVAVDFITALGDQSIAGEKTFSSVNGIKLPVGSPSEDRGVGLNGMTLEIFNQFIINDIARYVARNLDHVVAYNCRLSLSAGVLTLQNTGGNNLSVTDPAIFKWRDNTTSRWQQAIFTASPTFQDSASGNSGFVGTGTFSWGTTAAVAWANDMPLLIGVCSNGTTPIIVMARLPVPTMGVAANIGYKDVAPATPSQNNVVAWTATNITVSHANMPIQWFASIRIRKTAADDWTFQSLDSSDGIMTFQNFGQRNFIFPPSQNGAATGKFFKDNGGTAPVFTNNNTLYSVNMDGKVRYKFRHGEDPGVDGAGAVALQLATPYAVADTNGLDLFNRGTVFINWAAGANSQSCFTEHAPNTTTVTFFRNSTATARTWFLNSDFPNGPREVAGILEFDAVRF